ncbi:hypothetical protein JCM19055_3984 [Geomicrobium sp. JCM 19055]|nr:hypothetical protein JCM19055_3984 [Geomicrobium sp. JCM 19055]
MNYTSSGGVGIQRYATEFYKKESIAGISQVIEDGDIVTAITAIPSTHYNDKEKCKSLINENLVGTHVLEIDGESKTFTIDEVKVTLQPLASYFYTIVDEWGNMNQDMLARYEGTETLVIDIGWGTTDVALVGNGGLSDFWTIQASMSSAYREIELTLKEDKTFSTNTMQPLEIERQLRDNDVLTFSNRTVDASNAKKQVFKETAQQIMTEVNNHQNIEEMTTVIFTGGGFQALKEHLEPMISNDQGQVLDNIFFIEDCQLANAKGCYVFGKYISN